MYEDLVEIAKLLQFNDVEISYWALWVDKHNWSDPPMDTTQFLIVTAFHVKVQSEIEP